MSYMPDQENSAGTFTATAPVPASVAPGPAPQRQAMAAMAGPPSRVVGRTRNPWGVWLRCLTIVYPLIWYFKINKEMRDFDPSNNVRPGIAVLAITLGWIGIGIPAIVSWVLTAARIRKAQQLAGSSARCSLLLAFLCGPFGCVYVQSQLNKAWDQFGNPPQGTPVRQA
jgi:hypothetical protein